MIEGSTSQMYGSGSRYGRSKNMWIRWIRIRIRDTGENINLLSSDQFPRLGSEFHLGRKNRQGRNDGSVYDSNKNFNHLLLPRSELMRRSWSDASFCNHNTARNAQPCKPLPVPVPVPDLQKKYTEKKHECTWVLALGSCCLTGVHCWKPRNARTKSSSKSPPCSVES